MIDILKENYGFIFEEKLLEEIAQASTLRTFEEGDILIDFGDYIKFMPLLISGAIKILREDFDEGEYLCHDDGLLFGRNQKRNPSRSRNQRRSRYDTRSQDGRMVGEIQKLA
jgi:CRP-like cAMP-binding protein